MSDNPIAVPTSDRGSIEMQVAAYEELRAACRRSMAFVPSRWTGYALVVAIAGFCIALLGFTLFANKAYATVFVGTGLVAFIIFFPIMFIDLLQFKIRRRREDRALSRVYNAISPDAREQIKRRGRIEKLEENRRFLETQTAHLHRRTDEVRRELQELHRQTPFR